MDPELKMVLDAWRKEVVERDRLQDLCYELRGKLQMYEMKEDLQQSIQAWRNIRERKECED